MKFGAFFAVWILAFSAASQAKTAKIRWTRLKGAATYIVEISRNGKLISTDKTTTNRLRKVLPPGSYSFRVRATDKMGTEGQWTKSESVTIALPAPQPKFSKTEKDLMFSWTKVPEATQYRLSIQHNGKPLLSQRLDSNEYVLKDPEPGTYDWVVESVLQVADEPEFLGTGAIRRTFTINPPVRKVAATSPPPAPPEPMVSTIAKPPAAKTLWLGLNSYVLPYEYWTNGAQDRVAARGFSIDLDLDYFFNEKYYLTFRGAFFLQRINSVNHSTKILEASAGREEPMGSFVGFGGTGIRSEDWFHLTATSKDSFSTIGPVFFAGLKKPLGKFHLEGSFLGAIPVATYGQSNSTSPRELSGLTLNFETRIELGYQLTENFIVRGGGLWLPRHLNLTSNDFIENRGLSAYLGGQLAF